MSALFADYHTHPQGHRVQPYTLELLQPWVDSARAKGLRDLAFTDHDRYHAGIDFDVIARLRERNPDVKIRAGIELDNDPTTGAAGRAWVEKNWEKLDFVLGSVHYLRNPAQMFDSVPDGAGQFVGRPLEEIGKDYFARVKEMAQSGLVDCLAHVDLIKIHGHRVSAAEEVQELLDVIAARGLAIELSTAGWRKPVNELYPADEIILAASALNIPFTIASDAHSWAQLGENYDRLAEKVNLLGLNNLVLYEKHQAMKLTNMK